MVNERIAQILDLHYIDHYEKDGRIFADCHYTIRDSVTGIVRATALFEEVEDLTGCTRQALYDWLGY